jgi:hypothetical protein
MAQEANAQGNARDMLTWAGWPGRSGRWQRPSFRQTSLGRTESQMLSDACIAGIYFAKGALTKRTRMSNHRQ